MLSMPKEAGEPRVAVAKAEQYRAEARRLQERAETTMDAQIRLTLLNQAGRWLDIADYTERYSFDRGRRGQPCPG
jgi:hypothetical protein